MDTKTEADGQTVKEKQRKIDIVCEFVHIKTFVNVERAFSYLFELLCGANIISIEKAWHRNGLMAKSTYGHQCVAYKRFMQSS